MKAFCFILLVNVQDVLFFEKGKISTCFYGVFSVISFNFIIAVNSLS